MLSEKGQLLRTLAEHGNRKVAERLWHEWFKKASDTEVSILQKAQKELDLARPPHRGGVFLPLADKKGISGGLLVRVEFSDSPLGQEALDLTSQNAIAEALDAAWKSVRAKGPRPDVYFQFPFASIASVRGTSLWLPGFLAAVAKWGDAVVDTNILATGSMDDDIDLLQAKMRLLEDRGAEIGVDTLWVATRRAPMTVPPKAQVLGDTDEALDRIFSFRPWHHSADVVQCHVHCATRRFDPPARFKEPVTLGFKAYLEPDDLVEVREKVFDALRGPAAELSIAGPVALGAWLGSALRNHKTTVRVVHNDQVWCDNRKRHRISPRDGKPRALLVRCADDDGENEHHYPIRGVGEVHWTTIRAPGVLTPVDLPNVVEQVILVIGQGEGPVYVAVQGPIPLAFAMGAALQPLGEHFSFCQLQKTEYIQWFTGQQA
ncbi:MAG TPA: hypothetical protein PLV85_23270, partial [Polyangiaceae bacterium]|nr:hypothetical protein [Polyangiaceae bacterium]